MTIKDIQEIVNDIKYKDYTFQVKQKGETIYLQIIFQAQDNYTGIVEWQYCRKWQLSEHMVKSEIVRAAWKAVLAAEEHEAGEHFQYKGKLIYCPHVDVDALVEIAGRVDVRA